MFSNVNCVSSRSQEPSWSSRTVGIIMIAPGLRHIHIRSFSTQTVAKHFLLRKTFPLAPYWEAGAMSRAYYSALFVAIPVPVSLRGSKTSLLRSDMTNCRICSPRSWERWNTQTSCASLNGIPRKLSENDLRTT